MVSVPSLSRSRMSNAPLASRFAVTGWQIGAPDGPAHPGAVTFFFECDRFGLFSETVTFPGQDLVSAAAASNPGLQALLDLLHIALGVSYYKCAAAPALLLPASCNKPALCAMARALYMDGLAEFYIRAGLPYPAPVTIEFPAGLEAPAAPAEAPGPIMQPASPSRAAGPAATARKAPDNRIAPGGKRAPDDHNVLPTGNPACSSETLVAFGGGKDSHVAACLLETARMPFTLVSCVTSDIVASALRASTIRPLLFIKRALSPRLAAALEGGAYNGHVPITAINALAITVLGYLSNRRYTVFANERSADEATIDINGIEANHQFSKSGDFERILIAAIQEASAAAPGFFSILRPYSEIGIAKIFSRITAAHRLFTSCNRNFRISGGANSRWCGSCAKCAFTALMLAPYLMRARAQSIFGRNFLDKPDLVPIYRALAGLTEQKPWDCVGTINEVRATFYQLKDNPEWRDSITVETLLPEIIAQSSPAILERHWADGLEPAKAHNIPEQIWKLVRHV